MKRQIHAVRGHDRVVVPGHDVKLGRGGIREVEFFVQTQQLIFGGRRPQMRGSRTLDMLRQLRADNWVSAEAEEDLSKAYVFLRRIEHRLQMVADEQTQRLPFERAAARALRQILRLCTARILRPGPHPSPDAGRAPLRASVRGRADLDAPRPAISSSPASSDDPETLATLRALGFQHPEAAAETIRGWHFGRRAAVRSPRAREVLTELTPALLEAFAGSGDPDAALAAFDEALARMPASVELLSILRSNASLRELFGDVLGSAPRLAQVIASRPHVLDAAIDPGRVEAISTRAWMKARCASASRPIVAQAHSYEDALEPRARLRRRGDVPHRPQSPVGPARSRPRRTRLQRAGARPGRTAAGARRRRRLPPSTAGCAAAASPSSPSASSARAR